jgi:hypothetical protein
MKQVSNQLKDDGMRGEYIGVTVTVNLLIFGGGEGSIHRVHRGRVEIGGVYLPS